MPTVTIPLVGSYVMRSASPSGTLIESDQDFNNCFPEVVNNKFSRKYTPYITKATGHSLQNAVDTNTNAKTGFVVWLSKADFSAPAIFSFNQTTPSVIMQFFTQGGTQIGGDVANVNNCFEMADTSVSNVGNLVAVMADTATGVLEGWFFPEGGAWTQITDGDFPPNQGTPLPITGAPVQLDGYLFWMCRNGTIWNSDLNSVSAYTLTNFLTAQSYPDGGVGLARYKDYIVAFGLRTTEFFYNAGNATGSPLLPIKNSTLNIGAAYNANIRTILQVGGTVYWIGNDINSGKHGVYRLNGLQAEKVSNESIDKLLSGKAIVGLSISGIAGVFMMAGMQHIVFYNESVGNLTYNWCYCLETEQWWKHSGTSDQTTSISAAATGEYGKSYFTYFNTAQIAQIATGLTYETLTIQTSRITHGTNKRKFVKSIRLVGDNQASGTTTLEKSDDDYGTFTTLGTFDMTSMDKRITRCGSYKGGRAYRITHSANTAFRAEAIEVEYEVGTS